MRVARTQPPAGYRIPLHDLLRAACKAALPGSHAIDRLTAQVEAVFQARRAYAVSSGKAGLTCLLQALNALTGRRKVVLPAYTCYSVPAAIVRAGLEPVPCDIGAASFDYDYGRLEALLGPDTLCVLSVHLLGIPADTPRLLQLCRPSGIFVVEDAAQAMGGTHGGRLLGTCGDAGFYSLGRGKNVTAGGGGIIITSSPEIADALKRVVDALPQRSWLDGLATFSALSVLSVFVSPNLYWLPAGLPFLRLGETVYETDFAMRRLSHFQAGLLDNWPAQLQRLNAGRRRTAEYYLQHIACARDYGPAAAYLRFPLIVANGKVRAEILDEGRSMGMSAMYPTSVGGIPQLRLLSRRSFPNATQVSARLLTLPTHPLLRQRDLQEICDIVNAAVKRVPEAA
jgi:dTDP-4-amino-4,6-dideoxygalactose transaminase